MKRHLKYFTLSLCTFLLSAGQASVLMTTLPLPGLQTSAAVAATSPNTEPGGSILVITTTSDPFSNYYAEILRNEGLNTFNVSDISLVSSEMLANYDVVILARMTLNPSQVTMFSNWAASGGNLIAMRPDKQLSSLLGLTDTASTLSNGYLLVDTSKAPGSGIVNQTIQFHDTADRYTLNGATSIANLYTNATTATSNPAVTLRSIGNSGGQVAAFTYDLARSVVYTRQGNPAWAGQERDGFSPIRANDMFFGAASNDPQPDWIDMNKVAIPQADEQQRLLANLILNMNLDKKPLPRFWYFPHGKKAVVLMTGDDHGNGGTVGRFNQYKTMSPAGCSVEDWECVRGTSYIYPNTPISNAQAAAFTADGFEVGLHVNTNCANYTPTSLQTFYTQQLSAWSTRFPSVPASPSQRHHCGVWSDWATASKVELSQGIRLDTNYYFWPPNWVGNRPGFFTGSGMPMRFADLNGTLIDVYQATTQITDESGQTYPFTVNTLLDRALGAEGYYGVFTVNAHTDSNISSVSDAVVTSAQARGVPIVSARQMLTWLDGRNNSSFSGLAWNNNTLSFAIAPGTGTRGLQAMLPVRSAAGTVASITLNGSPVTYTTQQIKGIEYALFSATSGNYVATYTNATTDTTPPSVSSTSPSNGEPNAGIGSSVTATFSETVDPATINANTFVLKDSTNAIVPASVTYNAATRTATLQPSSSLVTGRTYTATVIGGTSQPRVQDLAGNPLVANFSWSFTTTTSSSYSFWNDTATPAIAANSDTQAVELGVKFKSDLNGYVTGIRFYKGSGNTGTYIGNLWTSTGQLLATATFSNETATGWQQVKFSQPVAINANTVYVASYHTSVGRYAINEGYFATASVDNPPLHFLRDGESGGNGVYKYGTTGFPNQTYRASNYWVDVTFATNATNPPPPVTDTTAPSISATSPSNGATNVSTSTSIAATFSEAIDPATINANTFVLQDANNALVPATVSYDAASRTATLQPSNLLATGATYRATLRGGTTQPRVQDLAGNALATNSTWSFTTAAAASTSTYSLWNSAIIPAQIATFDPYPVEVGVKFKSNTNGYITGIRFYKGSGNTGLHKATLWTSNGQQIATATFTNETATGWQQVNFAQPVPITANTVYVASYHTTTGNYAFALNYFANSGLDNGPLHALRDGANGGNGVFKYGNGGFPSQTFRSSNYFVDVVFTPNQ
ncbi:DUF4082 domain-containing protein [Chroococcidiopsidales cyanobacterium LEGE 13417]|nr:DUF4082 domain-containing protein [Chroococcidiopsidales cyanobacterium LEGE 13417]